MATINDLDMADRPPAEREALGRYSSGAMVLHWLIAAAFAVQIGLGWRMNAPRASDTFSAFQLHKSIGITILLLTLVRIGWRIAHRPPPLSPGLTRAEATLARTVHVGLYVVLLAMPLSGWLIVSSSRIAVPTYLYATIPWPHIPGIGSLSTAAKGQVNDVAATAHQWLSWIALAGIALHILGALKHQWFDRDGELGRMVPAPTRVLGGLALVLVVAFVGLMAAGRALPLPAMAVRSAAPAAGGPTPAQDGIAAAVPTPDPATQPVPAPSPITASATPTPMPTETAAPADKLSGWTVRRAQSSLRFHTAWSQGPVDGRFAGWQAAIQFDPAALDRASASVTVDMTSVTAADGDQQSALPGDDWFATATHPTATWKATRFTHKAGNSYVAAGTLSLRGVSRPLLIPFTLTIAGDVATMSGTAKIDRTIFGVGQGEWQSTADLPAIVTVSIAIRADRASK